MSTGVTGAVGVQFREYVANCDESGHGLFHRVPVELRRLGQPLRDRALAARVVDRPSGGNETEASCQSAAAASEEVSCRAETAPNAATPSEPPGLTWRSPGRGAGRGRGPGWPGR